ncbi:MAG: RNA polymerase sigma factor [Clostridia bacterium]|nr:RNA polymerase sigma factor [Clostridia bacterium]
MDYNINLEERETLDRDQALAAEILQGNTDAFSTLMKSYQERLYNFLLKLTSSREDSEEILQDVFVRVYNYLYKYNSNWNFSTWIYRITVNTFKDYYRKRKKRSAITYYDVVPDHPSPSNENPLETNFETRENYLQVVRLINALKEDQRIALILRHVQGFSYAEIASVLGVSPENAKMKVSRARQTVGEGFKKMSAGNAL